MSNQAEVHWVKTLVFLRHAKSDYPPGIADINRPLNGRGRMDAPAAGRWIESHVGVPEVVVKSPATRAEETWQLASGEWSSQPSLVVEDERIYEASVMALLAVISELPLSAGSALIIGHNPGMEDTVRALAQTADATAAAVLAHKLPTSAIAVMKFEGEWAAQSSGFLECCVIPRG